MYNIKDNIVALATAPEKAALSVVRCSGEKSLPLYFSLAKTKKFPRPNYVHLKTLYFNSSVLDQIMVTFFKGPKSYTGQDMIEFSAHGGALVAQRVIRAIESFGFRQAFPGEFSYRAFMGGKIDLVQAEAINSLIDANSHLDVLYSLNNLQGELSASISSLSKKLEHIITCVEHELDFEENEIDFITLKQHLDNVDTVVSETKTLLGGSFLSHQNKSNINVVIVGKTNVGKSSLFNALLGYDRSIVTHKKGTTRDTVESEVLVGETNITLIDTAGIRKTKETVEKQGISRTYESIKKATIVLFVDTKDPVLEAKKYQKLIKNKNIIYIQNKTDVEKKKIDKKIQNISVKENLGIEMLFTLLSTTIKDKISSFIKKNLFLISSRQKTHLVKCCDLLEEASCVGKKTEDLVVFVSCLRQAFFELEMLTGYKDKEKIINNIFSGFCVGK